MNAHAKAQAVYEVFVIVVYDIAQYIRDIYVTGVAPAPEDMDPEALMALRTIELTKLKQPNLSDAEARLDAYEGLQRLVATNPKSKNERRVYGGTVGYRSQLDEEGLRLIKADTAEHYSKLIAKHKAPVRLLRVELSLRC